ncbi:hypothetical protein ACOBQJ_05965 [Pelotomaculum propionicicum]
MTKLSQVELLNSAFKESLHREEQRLARYTSLSETIRDKRISALFKSFAAASKGRVKQIRSEAKNFNIKI